eukprot:6174688-Pleurochrysis_carterae.AAC.1
MRAGRITRNFYAGVLNPVYHAGAFLRACVHSCERACAGASVQPRVRACVSACVIQFRPGLFAPPWLRLYRPSSI